MTFTHGFKKTANSAAYDQFDSWMEKNHPDEHKNLRSQASTPGTAKKWNKHYQKWLKKDPEAKALKAEKSYTF